MNEEEVKKANDLFMEEFKALRDKHKRDFLAVPFFVPGPEGTWLIRVRYELVDTNELAVPSPFIPDDSKKN